MPKKGSRTKSSLPTREDNPTFPCFPVIAPKSGLVCRALLEDQIIIINELLSAEECKKFVGFIDGLPLELTPPKKKGEAQRVKYRFSLSSAPFAQHLLSSLLPHFPSFPYPLSAGRSSRDNTKKRLPHSCNSNIRVYKYTPSQHFGPHYDDSVKDVGTGARSEWTLLIYLTGIEDGVQGGETVFYKDQKRTPRESIVVPLTRGTALLHRHGYECLLHEGSPVQNGTKYVLRSDLMFLE